MWTAAQLTMPNECLIYTNEKAPSQTLLVVCCKDCLDAHLLFQVLVQHLQEFLRIEVMLPMLYFISVNTHRKILRHFAAFNGLDAYGLKGVTEINEFLVVVEFAPESKTSCPGKNRSNRVG